MAWINEPLDMVAYVQAHRAAGDWPTGALIRSTQNATRYSVTLRSEDDSIEHKFWGQVAKAKAWLEKQQVTA